MSFNVRIAALLCVSVVLAYANSLSGEFLAWDDESLVLENPYLREGSLAEIATFFRSPPRLATEPTPASGLQSVKQALGRRYELGGEYLPIRDLSWWLDARLFRRDPRQPGPPYAAFGFHLGNVLLHLATTLLVWRYVAGLSSRWVAAVTSLLFALHPIHTESVAWIASRKDVLSGAFFVAALIAHRRWRRGSLGTALFLLVALPLFLLGVMSKSTVMTLPLVFLLVDVTFFGAPAVPRPKTLAVYAPFFAIAMLFSWIVMQTSISTGLRGHGWHGGTFFTNLVLAAEAHLDYLGLLGFPLALRNAYENPETFAWSLKNVVAVIAVSALVVAFLRWWFERRRRVVGHPDTTDLAMFFVGWFFLTLLPVSNFLVPMNWLRAERYLYLPSIGFCWLAAAGLERARARSAAVTTVIVGVLLLAYGTRTIARNFDWHDTETVWKVTLEQDPGSHRALVELAACDLAAQPPRTAEGIAKLRQVTGSHPDLPRAHYLLGLALVKEGQFDEGLAELERALAREADPTWLANASHAWQLKAQTQGDRQDHAGAIGSLGRARTLALQRGLRVREDAERYLAILFNLATASRQMGKTADAERYVRELLALPADVVAPVKPQVDTLVQRLRSGT